jgi:hypothetical protein
MTNYCFALPFLPDGIDLAKKFARENGGSNREHDEFYRSADISREQVWIQRSPPGGGAPNIQIVSIETENPAQTFKEFAASNHPWAVKLREFAKNAYGLTGPPPPLNENIVDWQ